MLLIPLAQVPNQAVSFNADDSLWTVHVFQGANFMCADIYLNGKNLISGVRCFGGEKLLPYGYMTSPNLGNFVFDENADWTNFGASCNMYYVQQEELKELQAAMENWNLWQQ